MPTPLAVLWLKKLVTPAGIYATLQTELVDLTILLQRNLVYNL